MNGQKIAYIRVSSLDQNTERQLDGMTFDMRFEEKVSARNTDRPELRNCMTYCRAGDILYVHSIDRLARNLQDLLSIVSMLTGKGVTVTFVKENLTFDGSSENPTSTLMLQLLGSVAQFERTLIRQRQAEGIAKAKERGVYRNSGRRSVLSPEQIQVIRGRVAEGEKVAALAREYSVCRETVYKLLRESNDQESTGEQLQQE